MFMHLLLLKYNSYSVLSLFEAIIMVVLFKCICRQYYYMGGIVDPNVFHCSSSRVSPPSSLDPKCPSPSPWDLKNTLILSKVIRTFHRFLQLQVTQQSSTHCILLTQLLVPIHKTWSRVSFREGQGGTNALLPPWDLKNTLI